MPNSTHALETKTERLCLLFLVSYRPLASAARTNKGESGGLTREMDPSDI